MDSFKPFDSDAYSKCRGKLFIDIETGMATNPLAIQYLIKKTVATPQNKQEQRAIYELQKTALDPAFGEIHVISTAFELQEAKTTKREPGETELNFLQRAMFEIEATIEECTVEKFVAFNAQFDRDFIFKRCLIHGIKIPITFTMPSYWLCPMRMWNNGAHDFISLEKLCIAFGITAPKELDGSEVPMMLANDAVDQVAKYCESDVVNRLRPLFIKMERPK